MPLPVRRRAVSRLSANRQVLLSAPQNYATDGKNLLSNRHDKRREQSTDKNFGRGNVLFSDFHYDFIERRLTLEPRFYLPK